MMIIIPGYFKLLYLYNLLFEFVDSLPASGEKTTATKGVLLTSIFTLLLSNLKVCLNVCKSIII